MKSQDVGGMADKELDRALDAAFGPLTEPAQPITRTMDHQQAARDLADRIEQAQAAVANREALEAGKLLGPGIHPVAGGLVEVLGQGLTQAAVEAGLLDDVPFDGGVPAAPVEEKPAPKKRATRKPKAATPTRAESVQAHDATKARTEDATYYETMKATDMYPPKAATTVAPADDMFSAQATPGKKPKGAEPGESALVRRDGYGRYKIPHPDRWHALPEDQRQHAPDEPWTRATTFAKSISDTYVLDQWGNRMVAKGIALRPDLRALAAATPLTDRDTLNRIAEDAKQAAGSKVRANLGTAMHTFTESVDRGEEVNATPEEAQDLRAYRSALADAGVVVLSDYIEMTVVEPTFNIAGTFDRIVQHNGELVIGDLKTGRDLSYGWGEIAVQLAIYARASHIYVWSKDGGHFVPMPKVSQTRALVFHLPVGEAECVVYEVDIQQGWEAADLCARVREWRKTKNLARPLSRAVAAQPTVVVTQPTPMDRIHAATTKAELSALWKELQPQGLWTAELERAGKDQLAKFATA